MGDAFHASGNLSMTGARSSRRVFLNLTPFDNGSVGYSYRQLEDSHGPRRISSHGTELFASPTFSPWGWLSLQPYGELEHREYGDLDRTGHQSLFRLTADAWLIPDELVYRNTFKLSRTHNSTGLDVNLSFSADRYESRPNRGGSLDDYQVLLPIGSVSYILLST